MNKNIIMRTSCEQRFMPAVKALEEVLSRQSETPVLVAIDGKCASGKSTLGFYLQDKFGGNLFHMDDFFLRKEQRTEKRYQTPGGNVDYERFYEQVLNKILHKEPVSYQPFSCKMLELKEASLIPYQQLNIIEGSYSMHPYFKNPYTLKIFMDIDEDSQYDNIMKRNGQEQIAMFQERWIPMENQYFTAYEIQNGCLQIAWKKLG